MANAQTAKQAPPRLDELTARAEALDPGIA